MTLYIRLLLVVVMKGWSYMQLKNLKPLYMQMRNADLDRVAFTISFNSKSITVLYLTDFIPHIVAFQLGNYCFHVKVEKGFNLVPFITDYKGFCKALEIVYEAAAPFKPGTFFEHLDKVIPSELQHVREVQPHEVGLHFQPEENPEAIYFRYWQNNMYGHKHVSESNLAKTKLLLGRRVYEWAKKNNMSSKWSRDSNKLSDAKQLI